MADWPAYARILLDPYERRPAPTHRRTGFEDGAVRQAPAASQVTPTHTVTARIAGADLAAFERWAEASAGAYFSWDDPVSGVARQARVVGGAGGIAYRPVVGGTAWRAGAVAGAHVQVGGMPDTLAWDASMTIEEQPR